jgi:Proteasome-substrate-size regulator, mid region
VVVSLLSLAGKAQYSKDGSLMSTACQALSRMAYLEPDLVLPLVHERFQVGRCPDQ